MAQTKSLFKNSIYNVLYKCLNVIFPLITSVYASRILLSEGIGKVASAQNIVLYFTTIASLGIPTYGVKKIAENRLNRDRLSEIFFELFTINLFSTLVCSFVYFTMISSIDYFATRKLLYYVCGINIIFNIFNVDWFYQGIEEYRYIMLRSFAIKIISLVLLLVLVRDSEDYVYFALISSLALVLNYVFNIINLRDKISFKRTKLNVLQHLKPVMVLLAVTIAVEIYTLADTTMLTFICGDRVVGLYSNSMKIVKIVRSLIVAICAVFLPRLSLYYSQSKMQDFNSLIDRGIKVLFVLTLPTTIGLILVSNTMIPVLFGNAFLDASRTTMILSFSIITVAFSNFFGYQILVTIGKEKLMLYSTIIGAIVNVVLNAILITLLQQNGAAISSAVTEGCVALFQLLCVRKIIKIDFNKSFFVSTFCGLLCMCLVVLSIQYFVHGDILKLFLSTTIGALVYIVVMYISQNEIMVMFAKELQKKREDKVE